MAISIEIFFVTFASEAKIGYLRRRIDLGDENGNPDGVLSAQIDHAAAQGMVICETLPIVHSTSWRWEPAGQVVLTYLVYAERMYLNATLARTLAIDRLALAHSHDPARPRPPAIRERHVLSHGLRHFSFLIANGGHPTVGAHVSATARLRFSRLLPALGGNPCPVDHSGPAAAALI